MESASALVFENLVLLDQSDKSKAEAAHWPEQCIMVKQKERDVFPPNWYAI